MRYGDGDNVYEVKHFRLHDELSLAELGRLEGSKDEGLVPALRSRRAAQESATWEQAVVYSPLQRSASAAETTQQILQSLLDGVGSHV